MFNKKVYNIFRAAENESIADIGDSDKNNMSVASNTYYADGSIIIPANSIHPQDLIETKFVDQEGRGRVSFSQNNYTEYTVLQEEVINGIETIRNANKKILFMLLDSLFEDSNNAAMRYWIYGMVVSFDKTKLNILHPLIAAKILSGHIRLPDTFSILVYKYNHSRDVTIDSSSEDQKNELKESIAGIVSAIMLGETKPIVVSTLANTLEENISRVVTTGNRDINLNTEVTGADNVFIPVQLASAGIVFPWYGIVGSAIAGRDGYLSTNIFPMISGNIDAKMFSINGLTCTGNLDSKHIGSLYVLNNMNVESLYITSVTPDGYEKFVHACHSVSYTILKGANK